MTTMVQNGGDGGLSIRRSIQPRPVAPRVDVLNRRTGHAKHSSPLRRRHAHFTESADFPDLDFIKPRLVVQHADGHGSVSSFVALVVGACVPSKIFESVVEPDSVVVAALQIGRPRSNESLQYYSVNGKQVLYSVTGEADPSVSVAVGNGSHWHPHAGRYDPPDVAVVADLVSRKSLDISVHDCVVHGGSL